jgi:predicted DNA-binding protein (MmcQ/YjbR family)
MTLAQFRAFCAGLPGSRETFPFDEETLVLKVGSRMYALTGINSKDLKINLKCDPVLALDLRVAYPGKVVPGWHMNHEHWNTVSANGAGAVPDDTVCWMIRHSYDLVVEKLPRRERPPIEDGES